jgi:hypothetical protein
VGAGGIPRWRREYEPQKLLFSEGAEEAFRGGEGSMSHINSSSSAREQQAFRGDKGSMSRRNSSSGMSEQQSRRLEKLTRSSRSLRDDIGSDLEDSASSREPSRSTTKRAGKKGRRDDDDHSSDDDDENVIKKAFQSILLEGQIILAFRF